MGEACFPAFLCMGALELLLSLGLAGMLTLAVWCVLYVLTPAPQPKQGGKR